MTREQDSGNTSNIRSPHHIHADNIIALAGAVKNLAERVVVHAVRIIREELEKEGALITE